MKRIDPNHNYFVSESGEVVRPLKPRIKGGVRYWNLVIDGKLKAYSEKTLKLLNLMPHESQEKHG